jgi:hypothetical protein
MPKCFGNRPFHAGAVWQPLPGPALAREQAARPAGCVHRDCPPSRYQAIT